MANSLIDDTYEVVLDKVKNEAAVTKMRFGRTEWIRISPLDELVNHASPIDVSTSFSSARCVSTTHRHLTSFRFMTEFGYHRLSASDSTVLGEYNKSKFQELAQTIIDFMKLKPIPEWLKEENLASSLPPRKADSKKAKKSQ
ncbi:hypothetical protein BASA62_005211 [Batrachochytrium salamandrivorans]|nr:hypothetical protein BASA62_005211 [Batrachochytrium salamandrivorans]